MSPTSTPVSLLDRLRSNSDREAWARFVELYAPLVYQWLREFQLQHADACDLGQEVLLTVSRDMPTFRYDPGRGSFRGWLRVVVTNQLRGFWRKRRQLAKTFGEDWQNRLDELEDPASATSRRWDNDHDSQLIARAIMILKTDFETATWTAFWKVVVDGEKAAKVARQLGISENAVRLAKVRVLRRLRQELVGLVD